MHTFVIAEAGSSHHNNLKSAHNLIEAAKEAGADACKFQYWSSSKALAARRGIPIAEPVYAKYKLPVGWLDILADHCKRAQLQFMCSTFLIEDIAVVAPYVDRFKISAFESKWGEFIEAHKEYRREVIVSTNPGTKLWYGDNFKRLHCVSHYPTKLSDAGLSRIREEGLDGYSDHTANVTAGSNAVMMGSKIIEAHIRLDETPKENPDYGHSLTPFDFWLYVKHIREAEQML